MLATASYVHIIYTAVEAAAEGLPRIIFLVSNSPKVYIPYLYNRFYVDPKNEKVKRREVVANVGTSILIFCQSLKFCNKEQ